MFCPGCGSDESQLNQYCRVCGANLNAVRAALERPDEITASAITARDEIGRAVAAKIKETQSVVELRQVTWELLPVVSEFLESPAEKQSKREEQRLQRLRHGVVTASVGMGAAILAMFISMSAGEEFIPFIAVGILVFLIGLGIVINGLVFSVPSKKEPEQSLEESKQNALNQVSGRAHVPPPQLASPQRMDFPASVTEHTTHQLSEPPVLARPPRFTQE